MIADARQGRGVPVSELVLNLPEVSLLMLHSSMNN